MLRKFNAGNLNNRKIHCLDFKGRDSSLLGFSRRFEPNGAETNVNTLTFLKSFLPNFFLIKQTDLKFNSSTKVEEI
jgi:hypothetical protein